VLKNPTKNYQIFFIWPLSRISYSSAITYNQRPDLAKMSMHIHCCPRQVILGGAGWFFVGDFEDYFHV
jgi:hypothetical protein